MQCTFLLGSNDVEMDVPIDAPNITDIISNRKLTM